MSNLEQRILKIGERFPSLNAWNINTVTFRSLLEEDLWSNELDFSVIKNFDHILNIDFKKSYLSSKSNSLDDNSFHSHDQARSIVDFAIRLSRNIMFI